MILKRAALGIAFLSLFSVGVLPAPSAAQQTTHWRFPAEFEKQQAVWVGWLSKQYIKGYETDTVFLDIVRALAPHTMVRVCVPDAEHEQKVHDLLDKNGVAMKSISFCVTPFTMPFWRDFGPIFTVDETGNTSIADFGFNFWGYLPETHAECRRLERIDRTVMRTLSRSHAAEGLERASPPGCEVMG